MLQRDEETVQMARELGQNLRADRKSRFPRDTQGDFARRIGVSRYTYSKMERGDPSVALGSYLAAARMVGGGRSLVASLSGQRRPLFDE